MKLKQAFDVTRGDVVAFIGAGGKTSTLIGLGYELSEAGWRVLATTTTAISEEQLALFPYAMRYDVGARAISDALNEHHFVFLYDKIRRGQVYGPAVEWTPQLLDSVDSDVLLVEADRSGGKPFKAPYEDEPIIPLEASLVVPVVSLSVLGKPFDDEHVYNPQAMTDKYGFVENGRVKSPWLAQVLRDDELGLKGISDKARIIAFLNQTPDRGYIRGRARMIARLALQSERIHGVAFGSVRSAEPVHELQRSIGAVVLTGGQSVRMGQPKVLLPWGKNKTIIEHITEQLIRSRINHIRVVTGYYADEIKPFVKPLGVKTVHNRAYKTGEMISSLQAGLRAMPDNVAATLVVLGDQPRIQPKVIYQLLSAYARGEGDLLIPCYKTRRGHPILIGRQYWAEILKLRRTDTLQDILNAHNNQITTINVDTDSVLRNVDTLEDYHQERFRAGLSDTPLR
jgi:molybdenum cofactor cytidylyltransferase